MQPYVIIQASIAEPPDSISSITPDLASAGIVIFAFALPAMVALGVVTYKTHRAVQLRRHMANLEQLWNISPTEKL